MLFRNQKTGRTWNITDPDVLKTAYGDKDFVPVASKPLKTETPSGNSVNADEKPLSERGVTELRKLAKDAGIEGYTKMEKDALIAALAAPEEGKADGEQENAGTT